MWRWKSRLSTRPPMIPGWRWAPFTEQNWSSDSPVCLYWYHPGWERGRFLSTAPHVASTDTVGRWPCYCWAVGKTPAFALGLLWYHSSEEGVRVPHYCLLGVRVWAPHKFPREKWGLLITAQHEIKSWLPIWPSLTWPQQEFRGASLQPGKGWSPGSPLGLRWQIEVGLQFFCDVWLESRGYFLKVFCILGCSFPGPWARESRFSLGLFCLRVTSIPGWWASPISRDMRQKESPGNSLLCFLCAEVPRQSPFYICLSELCLLYT